MPYEGSTADTEGNSTTTRDNLRIALELTRRNLLECAAKQTARNKTLPPYPVFHPDQQVIVYRPYQDSDGPNPILMLPWRGPYVFFSLSPLVYRVRRMKKKNNKYLCTRRSFQMAASRVRIPWVALVGCVPSFGVGMHGILATFTYVTIYYRPRSVSGVFLSYVGRNARCPPDKAWSSHAC